MSGKGGGGGGGSELVSGVSGTDELCRAAIPAEAAPRELMPDCDASFCIHAV